jgi:hypothetical protein
MELWLKGVELLTSNHVVMSSNNCTTKNKQNKTKRKKTGKKRQTSWVCQSKIMGLIRSATLKTVKNVSVTMRSFTYI